MGNVVIFLDVDIFAIFLLLFVLSGLFFINYWLEFGKPKTKKSLLDGQVTKQDLPKASLVMLIWVAMTFVAIWIAALMLGITPQM